MRRTGVMDLKLHGGAAPSWLVSSMVKVAKGIFAVMVDEYGANETLTRLSDPLFFQACSNTLGFDWDSSGSTTVTCSVIKRVLEELELGIKVAGGKGKHAKMVPREIEEITRCFNISTSKIEGLKYASRMAAKVDNSAIQAGYQIYHHTFFITEKGEWAIVQQGVNLTSMTARRYHWLSLKAKSFVENPHTAIVGNRTHPNVLDMTAEESRGSRKVCTDLTADKPERLERQYLSIRRLNQTSLHEWTSLPPEPDYEMPHCRVMPRKMNWPAIRRLYELQPNNYEELLAVEGIGPATVRGLALISELIYGAKPSWKDPVKFTFAFGGKDGVPYPVDRRAMDKAAQVLKQAVEAAELGCRDKLDALNRLRNFIPEWRR